MSTIKIQGLQKSFGKNEVIRGIDLEIADSTFFGLIGKNGAGKSTLINILTGTTSKSSGAFWLLDTSDQSLDQVKRKIGVMPDTSSLYDTMTGAEFMQYMASLKKVKLSKREVIRLLDDVDLHVPLSRKIKDYSFGMKKKISIAQALLGDPQLLFLDEPTSGVDPESILHLQQLFLRLNQSGTTIFLASHKLNEIERLCTHIAILDKGIFQVNGEIGEIINNYTDLIRVKIQCDIPDNFSISPAFEQLNLIEASKMNMTFEVKSQEEIPAIITLLVSQNISIFSVNQQKATLEKIFLS